MNHAPSIANVVETPPAPVVVTQDRKWWSGVTLELYNVSSEYSLRYPAWDHIFITHYQKNKNSRVIQRRDGKVHEGRALAGMSIIVPQGLEGAYEGEPIEPVALRVAPDLMSRAASEIDKRAKTYEIINVFQTFDMTIGNIVNLLLSELDQPAHPAQALISDTLSVVLAGHLLRSYNAFNIQEHSIPCMGAHVLARVIAYIEDHSEAAIRLDELASIAGVSRFHFSRLFKASIGMSPMIYVERARIRKAQQLIQSGKLTLAEVAAMAGFADQSHFTRRFRVHTGCTPAAFARHKGIKLIH